MRSDSPSQTAMATAFLRALHLVVDEPPHVFEDTLATQFLPRYQQRFLQRLGSLPPAWLRVFRQRRSYLGGIRAQVLVRARYSEDALAAARSNPGIGRYVILAAGVDTFAWRQGEHAALPVVEVDHPATQRWKRQHLEQNGQPVPGNLTFVPLDFERSTLAEALPRPEAPQFISWLGTTYYLKPDSVAATLTALAEVSPPGSRLVLDYWQAAPGTR
ncbi:MAG: class I SAM-dependent methyltransferase [Gammaproteobacteria bacterium]|nr:class I SAM-dependent methyltransferase [Gammaproteobacteria bacterium]